MDHVSTRNNRRVIPEMAESVGTSKSSVSRQFIEESGQELEPLGARRFDQLQVLMVLLSKSIRGCMPGSS